MLHQSENSDGNELMEKLSNAEVPSHSFPVMRQSRATPCAAGMGL